MISENDLAWLTHVARWEELDIINREIMQEHALANDLSGNEYAWLAHVLHQGDNNTEVH